MSVFIYLIGFYKMAVILRTNTIGLLTMFCFGCLTIYSADKVVKATKCNDNQHCSDCNSTTGHCITECDPGHYDKKCMSVCSDNCRSNKCIMSNTGSDYCTEGCVLGYQGPGCGTPCYNPGDNCTACPGVCDGGYCQLASSCYYGCVDSFYGTDCQNCSSGCTACNRMTGTCDDKLATQCHDNQHCSGCDSTTGHCITGCEPGYYDKKCMSVCSDNCRNNKCISSNTGSDNCTEGCVRGYQGTSCNTPCDNPGGNCTACPGGCDGGYCQLRLSCVSGCVDSYYGTDCKNCSSGCTTCNRMTGTCDDRLVKSEVIDITVNGRRRITVGDKANVTFRCKVQGDLLPNVSIIHEGHSAPAMDMIKKSKSVYERVIRISNCSQYGEYFCRVANTIGLSGHKQQLAVVQAKPRRQATSTLEMKNRHNGKHPFGKISFTLCSYPVPLVTLSRFEGYVNSKNITGHEKYKLTDKYLTQNVFEYTFIINNITDGDFGAYVFSVLYAEGMEYVIIVASPSKEISSNSISIIIGCSILAAAFIAVALIIRSRLEQIRAYWNLRFQHFITHAQDNNVSVLNVAYHSYDVIEEAGLYDSVNDGQNSSGHNANIPQDPGHLDPAEAPVESLTEEYESFCVDGIMQMAEVDMPAVNPESTSHGFCLPGSDTLLGSIEDMLPFVTEIGIKDDDTERETPPAL